MHSRLISCITLMGFLLLSCVYFGHDNLHTFNEYFIGNASHDKYFYAWCLLWWPYALLHGLNPFLTSMAWAPTGTNLAISTPIPGLALLAAPITLTAGVIAAYNTIAIITPALAAWSMYVTCRYLTGATLPALFAGYIFGFSSYEVSHMLGHLNLTAGIFLLPLLLYLALRYLYHDITTAWFIVSSTLCAWLLFLISTELFVVNALFAGVALILAYWLMPPLRQNLCNLCKLSLCYYGITAILVAPYLYYFFMVKNAGGVAVSHYYADLFSVLIPTPLFWLSNHTTKVLSSQITTNFLEQNIYLGLPLVIIIALFWRENKDQPHTKFLCWLTMITLILSVGPALNIADLNIHVLLPWHFIFDLPMINIMQPNRFGLFLSVYAAIILALWLQTGKSSLYLRYTLAICAVIFLLPSFNPQHRKSTNMVNLPPFFSQHMYENYLKPHDNVLFLPFLFTNSPYVLWQTQTNFYFRMANGLIWIAPPKSLNTVMVNNLMNNQLNSITPAAFKQFIIRKKIDVIIASNLFTKKWQRCLSNLGIKPHAIGGIQFYRISNRPPLK